MLNRNDRYVYLNGGITFNFKLRKIINKTRVDLLHEWTAVELRGSPVN